MKNVKFLLVLPIFLILSIITTGCTQDNMDNISIIVTNYPNEYITKKLYSIVSIVKYIVFIQMVLMLIIIK